MIDPAPVPPRGGHLAATRHGILFAGGAFALWGVVPVYFKAIAAVPALEVLAHRIVWGVVALAVVLAVSGGLRRLRGAVPGRREALLLTTSALLLSVNWLVFIWAIADGQVLQTSLGYYINPLVNVVLGVLFLGERLNGRQWTAVALAAAGGGNLVLSLGLIPWIALTLAGTFGVYGLIRKVIATDALTGLFVESLLVLPPAAAFLAWLAWHGGGAFGHLGATTDLLLLAAGIVTVLPLALFIAGARRLDLTTVGFLQYIAPTGHFLLAVFVYHESFTAAYLVTFVLIWAGLAVYSFDLLGRGRRRAPAAETAP